MARSHTKRRSQKKRSSTQKKQSACKRHSKRHSKRRPKKSQKGGEGSLLKSFLLDPVNKSSNLLSNLKDHNVLVDRFGDMKNEISKINKRLDQLESAFKKLQLQK